MRELLLEIYSEEIPALSQQEGAKQLLCLLQKRLKGEFNEDFSGKYFYTPRRIGVVIKALPTEILDKKTFEIRGPRVNAPYIATEGFKKKHSHMQGSLVQRDGYIYLKACAAPLEERITNIIVNALSSLVWPKSMRWGEQTTKWIRPIHSILCMLGDNILPVRFSMLEAGNKTEGNWLLNSNRLSVTSYNDYRDKLRKEKVLICPQERKSLIKSSLSEILAMSDLKLILDHSLLDEVNNLVEFPFIGLGKIDQRFMSLPKEVLINTLRTHQKYLMTQYKNGVIAPFFVIVSSVMTEDNLQSVISGNERVLQARLSDAEFFFREDIKTSLASKTSLLREVKYHDKVGSYYDKIMMVKNIAVDIASQINVCSTDILRASILIKSDLVTQMVHEQPDLQGIIGYYYALHDGENINIAHAIRDHYLPQNPQDEVPTRPLSIVMALADKIVTLNSMFNAGIKPNGSKDPYALRRTAISIIRIVCANALQLKLNHLLNSNVSEFLKERLKNFSPCDNGLREEDIIYIASIL